MKAQCKEVVQELSNIEYTWVERGTVRVKCLTQEHNTMSPARARTRSTRSGVERANHDSTAPPNVGLVHQVICKHYHKLNYSIVLCSPKCLSNMTVLNCRMLIVKIYQTTFFQAKVTCLTWSPLVTDLIISGEVNIPYYFIAVSHKDWELKN